MGVSNFRDLLVWQKGKSIASRIYRLTSTFPSEEKFGLANQMRRAAISIPSNIAEGFYRFQKKEFRRFLSIALGSCAELETQIELAIDLNFTKEHMAADLKNEIISETRMIKKLINHS